MDSGWPLVVETKRSGSGRKKRKYKYGDIGSRGIATSFRPVLVPDLLIQSNAIYKLLAIWKRISRARAVREYQQRSRIHCELICMSERWTAVTYHSCNELA
jgi:hypothetical protein